MFISYGLQVKFSQVSHDRAGTQPALGGMGGQASSSSRQSSWAAVHCGYTTLGSIDAVPKDQTLRQGGNFRNDPEAMSPRTQAEKPLFSGTLSQEQVATSMHGGAALMTAAQSKKKTR